MPCRRSSCRTTIASRRPCTTTRRSASRTKARRGSTAATAGSARDGGTGAARARVGADLERAASWAGARGVPLFLGEFGATSAARMDDRAAWTAHVRTEAERIGIAWCYWDFDTEFGAFDGDRRRWHEPLRAA